MSSTWIFLRGLTRESRHWGDFPAQFARAMPDSRVVTPDLPGNGRLHGQRSPMSVPEMVAACRAALAQQQIAPPYHLLAMSLGAMVAVAWSQAHPQELAASVLINTSLRPFSPFYQRLRPQHYATLLRLVASGAPPEVWERTLLRLTTHLASADVLPVWVALRQDSPVSRANALRQLWAAARYRAPLQRPAVPTLVLTSARDALVSSQCSHTLARRWQCELRVHPRAGHDLPLDDGPWVAAQVQAWLAARPEGLPP